MTGEHEEISYPTRSIHAAYREALDARQQYQQATGGPMEPAAHEQLHDAVASYYEIMRPLVSSANATEDLWTEEPLWPTEPIYVEVALCPACGAKDAADEADETRIGEMCPNCERAVIERSQMPKTDDNGRVEYDHVEGLKAVDNVWTRRVERTVEYSDALGTHRERKTESLLLDPSHLQSIARTLDEALNRLDLHADIDDDVTTTELDNEDLDAFQEQLQSIHEEWSDDSGLEDSEVVDS